MLTHKTKLLVLALGLQAFLVVDLPCAPRQGSNDSKLGKLLEERLATLREVASLTKKLYEVGMSSLSEVTRANRALLEAELELCQTDKERIAVLEKMVAQAKLLEEDTGRRFDAGVATHLETLEAKAGRLEVQIALERAMTK